MADMFAGSSNKDGANFITVKYTDYGEYHYFATFVVSFGQRAMPTNDPDVYVARLWANDELIYDAAAGWYKPGFRFKFFPGTEDQGEVMNGFHYRGLMCILVYDMDLTDYGDSIPALNVELVDSGLVIDVVDTLLGVDNNARAYVELDVSTDRILQVDNVTAIGFGAPTLTTSIQSVRLSTKAKSTKVTVNNMSYLRFTGGMGLLPDPSVRCVAFIPGTSLAMFQENSVLTFVPEDMFIVNTETGQTLGQINAGEKWRWAIGFQSLARGRAENYFIGWADAATSVGLLYTRNGKPYYVTDFGAGDDFSTTPLGMARGRKLDDFTEILVTQAGEVRLLKMGNGEAPTMEHDQLYAAPVGATIYNTYFDPRDQTAVILVKVLDDLGFAVKVDMTGDTIWTSDEFTLPNNPNTASRISETSSNMLDGTLAVRQGQDDAITIIDLDNGDLEDKMIQPGILLDASAPVLWDSQSRTLYSNSSKYVRIGAPVEDVMNVGDVIGQYAVRAGYAPEDVVITGMEDMPIWGYVLSGQSDLASLATGLASLYGFTWVERTGQFLATYNYDEDSELVVNMSAPADRLATINENSQDTSVDPVDIPSDEPLPVSLSVTYFDRRNEYRDGFQIARRSKFPHRTQNGTVGTDLSLPIVLDGDTALQLAYKALFRTWGSRIGHSLRLPAEGIELDPSDVLEFTANGFMYTAQIAQHTVNGDNSVSLALVELATASYPVAVEAQPGTAPPRVPTGTPINCIIFDAPSLRASDEHTGELNLLVLMGGYRDNKFDGGRLETSSEDAPDQWSSRLAFTRAEECLIGAIISEFPDVENPFVIDETTVLTVRRGNIPLSRFVPASDAEMEAGANLVIIGASDTPEYIAFGEVSVIDDDTVELSRLLRGRFGTDVFANSHSSGDVFAFLDNAKIITYLTAEAGKSILYRALGNGQPEWQADVQMVSPEGNNRKPYAPFDIEVTREVSGRVLTTWKRRARFFNSPPTNFETEVFPEDETPISYTWEVYTPDWSILLRRVTGRLSEDYEYWVEDQTEDQTNEYSEYNIMVYQENHTHIPVGFPAGGTFVVDEPELLFIGTIHGNANISGLLTVPQEHELAGVVVGGGDIVASLSHEQPDIELIQNSTTSIIDTGTTINKNIAADALAGDLLIAVVMHRSALTTPAGWSVVQMQTTVGASVTQYLTVLQRTAVPGDEGDAVNFVQASSGRMNVKLMDFRRDGGLSILDDSGVHTDEATSNSITLATVTITAENQRVLTFATSVQAVAAGNVTWTMSTGWTFLAPDSAVALRTVAAYRGYAAGVTSAGTATKDGTLAVNGLASITLLLG